MNQRIPQSTGLYRALPGPCDDRGIQHILRLHRQDSLAADLEAVISAAGRVVIALLVGKILSHVFTDSLFIAEHVS